MHRHLSLKHAISAIQLMPLEMTAKTNFISSKNNMIKLGIETGGCTHCCISTLIVEELQLLPLGISILSYSAVDNTRISLG